MPDQQTWLEQWGTLLVASVALIQPWIAFVLKRFFKSPVVRVFEAGKIEIGYSGLGPTIALNGTLKVENKDVFIRGIDLELVRERDRSTHYYEWSLFRANKIRLSQLRDTEVELAAGFMLSTNQPHRYNILFIENKSNQELQANLQILQKGWNEYLRSKLSSRTQENPPLTYDQQRLAIYDEFSQTPLHVETWSKIDRARYWEVGSYSISMTVKTSNPDKLFKSTKRFTLDDANARSLSYNESEILQSACNVGTDTWNFAYCVYEN